MLEQGRCKEAEPRLLESDRAEPNVGARLSLAECAVRENRLADAWNDYALAAALATAKGDTDRAEGARQAAADLTSKVLRVTLTLPPGERFEISLDAQVLSDADRELLPTGYAIEPSVVHTFKVSAPNHPLWIKADVIGYGGDELPPLVVTFDSEPTSGDDAPRAHPEGSTARRVAIVGAAAGAVGLAVGAIFGGLALGTRSSILDACGSYPAPCSAPPGSQNDRNARLKAEATVSSIGFVAGSVLIAAGAILYVAAPRDRSKRGARLSISPMLGSEMAGGRIGGSF
jgi:hypothetical protein